MENKNRHPIKNNSLSSSFLLCKGLNMLQNKSHKQLKEDDEKVSHSSPTKNHSESQKNNNKLSLEQFMENQNKKHLTTKFAHKDAEKFLKEKDKAMEKIIIEEDIINNNEIEEDTNENDMNDNNNKENNIKDKKLVQENKGSNLLIFNGTFGKEEYLSILNNEKENHHHHHHHHHRHHHHHHHHLSKKHLLENKNINEQNNKKEDKSFKF